MHLSLPVAQAAVRSKAVVLLLLKSLLIVTSIVGFCNCSMFSCALLRELVALLCLSSWCLVIIVWLFLVVLQICLQFVTAVFPDHTLFVVSQSSH